MNSKPVDGEEIISLLRQYALLDWTKTIRRYPVIESRCGLISPDQSTSPPFILFRLKNHSHAFIRIIREAVDSFNGNLVWALTAHDRAPLPGTNWTILPKIAIDVEAEAAKAGLSRREYVKQHMPEIGPMAYDDLPSLHDHLRDKIEASGLTKLVFGFSSPD